MKRLFSDELILADYLECFGNFRSEDPVCRTLCAINIRCAIEQDHNNRLELIEEVISTGENYHIIQ
jgi:hypothetical protein